MKRKIGNEIREFQQLLFRKYEADRMKDKIPLTHVQTRVIFFVYQAKTPVFQKDIEALLKVRRSTATEILNILQRDGYLKREKVDYDKRLKVITLTDKSLQIITDIGKHVEETEKMLRQGIDKESLSTFFKVLDKIKENLR